MTDIVERLRELRMSASNADWNSNIVNAKLDEAADEIERLREGLQTIADNHCCGTCQEAALVAKRALEKGSD